MPLHAALCNNALRSEQNIQQISTELNAETSNVYTAIHTHYPLYRYLGDFLTGCKNLNPL